MNIHLKSKSRNYLLRASQKSSTSQKIYKHNKRQKFMAISTPFVIVNFKTYKEASGNNAVKLAKICGEVSKKQKIEIAVAVQPADIYRVAKAVSIKVLAQHIDAVPAGQFSGHIFSGNIKENGAFGTLLNHSERQISLDALEKSVNAAKSAGLLAVVCASTPEIAQKASSFNPDFIAIEPPELIGGNISVSTAKPEIITNTIKKIKNNVPVLCGAGIKTEDDVRKACQLGAKGIILASGVALAKNQRKALLSLVNGFRE